MKIVINRASTISSMLGWVCILGSIATFSCTWQSRLYAQASDVKIDEVQIDEVKIQAEVDAQSEVDIQEDAKPGKDPTMQDDANADAGQNALMPDQNAAMPVAKGPAEAVPMKRNLFGELIGDAPDQVGGDSGESPMLKRVKGLIERTNSLDSEYRTAQYRMTEVKRQLQEKSNTLQRLPTEYERATLTLVNIQLKLNRLSAANVLSMPPNDPNVINYQQSKLQAKQLEAEIKVMVQQNSALPGQIQTLKAEFSQLQRQSTLFPPRYLELIASWDSVSTPLRWLAPSDLQAIQVTCNSHLAQYPDAHLVTLMNGYGQLHLNQTRTAIEGFKRVLSKLATASDPISTQLRFKASLGLAWAAIADNDDDLAGKLISEAGRFSKRDYELALVKGLLLELRGQSGAAFDQFRRAVSIDKENPHGYRLASNLVLKTKTRDVSTALALAKFAVQYDESNDWRNQLTLAACYKRLGEGEQFDAEMKDLNEKVSEEAKAELDAMLTELVEI